MDKKRRVFKDGAVAIDEGKILDVGKTKIIQKEYKADKIIDAKKKVVLPGLINSHIHSGLIRGTADDMSLEEWLGENIYPMHKVLRPEDAYVAALLSYSECVKSGTTCVLDMYRYMHRCADAAEEVGIRAILAPMVADSPEYGLESFEDNVKLIKDKPELAKGRIKVWFGLENLFCVSPELISKATKYARKYGVGIHMHSSVESLEEVETVKKRYGKRSIQIFHDAGMLGPDVVLAHCIWLRQDEIEMLAKTGTHAVHCPTSNMKVPGGVAPVPELIDAGVNVGLGTDGLKENNNFDMLEEMKFAALLHKVNKLDATTMPANQVLEMATINGAKALGLEEEIGSIGEGKKADIITVDLHKLHLTPVLFGEFFNAVSHLVYAANGADVNDVIIDGKIVMEDRKLKNVNEDKIIEEATRKTQALLERRKRAPVVKF